MKELNSNGFDTSIIKCILSIKFSGDIFKALTTLYTRDTNPKLRQIIDSKNKFVSDAVKKMDIYKIPLIEYMLEIGKKLWQEQYVVYHQFYEIIIKQSDPIDKIKSIVALSKFSGMAALTTNFIPEYLAKIKTALENGVKDIEAHFFPERNIVKFKDDILTASKVARTLLQRSNIPLLLLQLIYVYINKKIYSKSKEDNPLQEIDRILSDCQRYYDAAQTINTQEAVVKLLKDVGVPYRHIYFLLYEVFNDPDIKKQLDSELKDTTLAKLYADYLRASSSSWGLGFGAKKVDFSVCEKYITALSNEMRPLQPSQIPGKPVIPKDEELLLFAFAAKP